MSHQSSESQDCFPLGIIILTSLSHLLLILNSSLNVFIYTLKVYNFFLMSDIKFQVKDSKFRKECVTSLRMQKILKATTRPRSENLPSRFFRLREGDRNAETFFIRFSKSESLDSNYSRSTSLFGYSSSRQSSQD